MMPPSGPPQGGQGDVPPVGDTLAMVPEAMGKIINAYGKNLPPEAVQCFTEAQEKWQEGMDILMGGVSKEEPEEPQEAPEEAPPTQGRRQFV